MALGRMALGRMGDPFSRFEEFLHGRGARGAGDGRGARGAGAGRASVPTGVDRGGDAFSRYAEMQDADALAAPTAPAALQVHSFETLAAHLGMNPERLPPGHYSAFTVDHDGGRALRVGPNQVSGAAWGAGPLPSFVLQMHNTQQSSAFQIVPRSRPFLTP